MSTRGLIGFSDEPVENLPEVIHSSFLASDAMPSRMVWSLKKAYDRTNGNMGRVIERYASDDWTSLLGEANWPTNWSFGTIHDHRAAVVEIEVRRHRYEAFLRQLDKFDYPESYAEFVSDYETKEVHIKIRNDDSGVIEETSIIPRGSDWFMETLIWGRFADQGLSNAHKGPLPSVENTEFGFKSRAKDRTLSKSDKLFGYEWLHIINPQTPEVAIFDLGRWRKNGEGKSATFFLDKVPDNWDYFAIRYHMKERGLD